MNTTLYFQVSLYCGEWKTLISLSLSYNGHIFYKSTDPTQQRRHGVYWKTQPFLHQWHQRNTMSPNTHLHSLMVGTFLICWQLTVKLQKNIHVIFQSNPVFAVRTLKTTDRWLTGLRPEVPKCEGAPLAFTCKMSLKDTWTNQEEPQNDHNGK